MSRLSSYFLSAKLAKMHMDAAKDCLRKGHRDNYELNVIHALENMLSAMNNVASIGFNAKPKRDRRAVNRVPAQPAGGAL